MSAVDLGQVREYAHDMREVTPWVANALDSLADALEQAQQRAEAWKKDAEYQRQTALKVAEQALERERQLGELWRCPDGHITNNPSPIPGRGDDKGDCPYPCMKRMRRL